jgi:hypothetical protein
VGTESEQAKMVKYAAMAVAAIAVVLLLGRK